MAGNKQIYLSGSTAYGQFAIVDDEDYDRLISFGVWHLSSTGYAVRRTRGKTVRMHRLVNNTPEGLFTDHLNNNRLDNRKSNLRTVTHKENMQNYSGAKHYCWDDNKQLWLVSHKGKFYGRYKTEAEAQQAVKEMLSGVPKPNRLHPRRKYLPSGICYMQPFAQKDKPPYYIRKTVDGKRIFKGYFSSIQEAENALNNILV